MANFLEDKELIEILKSDDKERFMALLSIKYGEDITTSLVLVVAHFHAKKCLLALIDGEGCKPALELYASVAPYDPQTTTPLASVVFSFPEALDIITLLLNRGPLHHANIKCRLTRGDLYILCPLDRLLFMLSRMSHLLPWNHRSSVIKLIILLCQWDTKSKLDCARLLVPYTNGINDIAWTYIMEGNLAALAGLLLVAREKVLVPFHSGILFSWNFQSSTIRYLIMDMLLNLSSEGDLDDDGVMYQSMLIDALMLFDIFERAGDALSLYCSSMHEYVPPHKVLEDVATILKNAGYTLEPRDLDLRDCFRDCHELRRPSVFKLSDPGRPNNKYLSPSSLARPQRFHSTHGNYPYHGNCQLFNKLNSGQVLNFMPSTSEPRLFRTVVGPVENGVPGILQKHLAYIAFKLKRGIKF